MLLLVAGGIALGLLAISATNYVMRLDQQAGEVGSVPMHRSTAHSPWAV